MCSSFDLFVLKFCLSYLDDLFHIFEKLQGVHRTQCLEMILNRLAIINNSYEKITELNDFLNILKDKYVFTFYKLYITD